MNEVNRLIVATHGKQGQPDPGACRPSGQRRRQARAADADSDRGRISAAHQGSRHHGLAAAVEFIHTATLLHDDVVDQSDLRRGNATANAVWGNQPSVLVGDFLFARAFQLMVEDGSIQVLKILSDASAVIAEGEVAQLITANDTETTEAAYMEVIISRRPPPCSQPPPNSAPSSRIGRGPTRIRCEAMARTSASSSSWSTTCSITTRGSRRLGKNVGDDFKDGKITLPVVLAFERGDEDEKTFWQRTLEEGEQHTRRLHRPAIQLMEPPRHPGGDSMTRATNYADQAKSALDRLPRQHHPPNKPCSTSSTSASNRIY